MTKIHYINGSALPWRVSGRLCLDFVNTIEPRDGIAPNQRSPHADKLERREYLRTYADVVAWGMDAQTLSPVTAQHLLDVAHQQPAAAQAALEWALHLRETIYRLFWMIAQYQTPASADIRTLFHAVADTAPHLQLLAGIDHVDWQWQADDALDQMLWPVLSDAVALLVHGDPNRINVCPGVPEEPVCGWLFYDASKNQSRQWCSMEECGNAAKARRQTAHRRAVRGRAETEAGSRS